MSLLVQTLEFFQHGKTHFRRGADKGLHFCVDDAGRETADTQVSTAIGCGGTSVVVERGLGGAINRPAGIGRARRTA